MAQPQFAEQYPRLADGIIDIPDDKGLRQALFLRKVEHPAKNNLYLLDAITDYLTKPGDRVLDPMAGGGSTMYVARKDRSVTLIELEPAFVELLYENRPGFTGEITIIPGDCRKILPIPGTFDLIMFSPPYANQLKASKGAAVYDPEQRGIAQGIVDFVTHPDNLSKLSEFWFNQAMSDVYERCLASLKPTGYMVIIIKDQMRNRERVRYAEQHSRMAMRLGFELAEWHQHKHIGKLWGFYNIKHGIEQVEEEDILMFRRHNVT